MKILLTGAAGQLGHALPQQLPAGVELIATSRTGAGGDSDGGAGLLPLDLADAGAYTAVDKAESEPELAMAVNGGAPRAFAEHQSWCQRVRQRGATSGDRLGLLAGGA